MRKYIRMAITNQILQLININIPYRVVYFLKGSARKGKILNHGRYGKKYIEKERTKTDLGLHYCRFTIYSLLHHYIKPIVL